MPDIVSSYEECCILAGSRSLTSRFLSGFQPPPYIRGCSQAVLLRDSIALIRNYDYHPALTESTMLLSQWNDMRVIAMNDCLMGVLDGMNQEGLAVSLAFGGGRKMGKGFGIPFILRYVLEFSSNVSEALAILKKIPSHMAYNITLVDKTGKYATVQLRPDNKPIVTDKTYSTNHQQKISWPQYAAFSQTLERGKVLEEIMTNQFYSMENIIATFLQPPLYQTEYSMGFGTMYTAIYFPEEGKVTLLWKGQELTQSFETFTEKTIAVTLPEQTRKSHRGSRPVDIPGQ